MEALNKKIPNSSQILGYLAEVKGINLTFSSVIVSFLSIQIDQTIFLESLITASAFFSLLMLAEKMRRPLILFSSISIAFLIRDPQFSMMLIAASVFYLALAFIGKRSEEIAYLVLGALTSLGDGLTTFTGLREGLSERNPFLYPLLQNLGEWAIIPVKMAYIPLLLYIYLEFETEEKLFLLKSVYVLGLYLTVSNLALFF